MAGGGGEPRRHRHHDSICDSYGEVPAYFFYQIMTESVVVKYGAGTSPHLSYNRSIENGCGVEFGKREMSWIVMVV